MLYGILRISSFILAIFAIIITPVVISEIRKAKREKEKRRWEDRAIKDREDSRGLRRTEDLADYKSEEQVETQAPVDRGGEQTRLLGDKE